jgi:lipoyl(octanoyl) transferase
VSALPIRDWGRVDCATTAQAMADFTAQRQSDTTDELWLCEHPPVFTQG